MIEINYKGKTYEMKSELNEISISLFDEISRYILGNKNLNTTNQRIELIKKLGIPNEVANSLGYKSLIKISQNIMTAKTDGKILDSIEIDGVKYERIGGEDFYLTAGQVARIEEALIHDDRMARVFSIVYNIDKKIASEKVTADIATPVIIECEKLFLESLNEIK